VGVSVGIYRGQTALPAGVFEGGLRSRRSTQMVFLVCVATRKNFIDAAFATSQIVLWACRYPPQPNWRTVLVAVHSKPHCRLIAPGKDGCSRRFVRQYLVRVVILPLFCPPLGHPQTRVLIECYGAHS
jgi:hypothetical protein